MIYLILVLGTLLFVLLLLPTLSEARITPEDTRRRELEEERDQLLANLRDLQGHGEEESVVTREKVRLTSVLGELDQLPPTLPQARAGKPVLPVALGLLLGITVLVVVGTFTFLPRWRYAGMSPVEATQLQYASKLPALQAKAEKSGAIADNTALGDAAWEAQNYQLAAQAYTQVLMKDRENAKALRRAGFFLLNNEQMAEDGLGFIQRSVKVAPKEPEGHLLLGYALGLFGQYDAGLKSLKTYQTLAPESHEADSLIVEFQGRTGKAVDGALVYAQNCASCHGSQGEGGKGPKLVGLFQRKNEAAVSANVLNGGMAMPAFPQLQGQQLDALLTYLKGL